MSVSAPRARVLRRSTWLPPEHATSTNCVPGPLDSALGLEADTRVSTFGRAHAHVRSLQHANPVAEIRHQVARSSREHVVLAELGDGRRGTVRHAAPRGRGHQRNGHHGAGDGVGQLLRDQAR